MGCIGATVARAATDPIGPSSACAAAAIAGPDGGGFDRGPPDQDPMPGFQIMSIMRMSQKRCRTPPYMAAF